MNRSIRRISTQLSWSIALLASLPPALGQSLPPRPAEVERTMILLEKPVRAVAVSGDGARLACGGYDRLLQVFDARSGRRLFLSHPLDVPIAALAMSRDGNLVVSGGAANVGWLWPPPKTSGYADGPRPWGGLGGGGGLSYFDSIRMFRPDSPFYTHPIIGGASSRILEPIGGLVQLWRLDAPGRSSTLASSGLPILAVQASSEQTHVSVIGADLRMTCVPIDVPSAGPVALSESRPVEPDRADRILLRESQCPMPMTSFSADGLRAVTLTNLRLHRLALHEASKPEKDPRYVEPFVHTSNPWTVAMSPDGRRFATTGADGVLAVWSFESGTVEKVIGRTEKEKARLGIPYLTFLDDSDRLLAIDGGGVVRLWSVDSGRVLFRGQGPTKDVRSAVLHGSTLTVVSGAYRGAGSVDSKSDFLVVWRFVLEAARKP